ncbi:MAG: right-handed parallel beta-helix repeat-containing protein, partial [Candidatus Lokiarchaeota archaeon]|nr:right-handed parallel beta-helix repeat-containing protein [Candidatus Lokiarchaeota archaeon]
MTFLKIKFHKIYEKGLKKNKKIKYFNQNTLKIGYLLITLLILVLGVFLVPNFQTKNNLSLDDKTLYLKKNGYWILSDPIIIDDTGTNNWAYYKSLAVPWLSGEGSSEQPYIIENVTINGDNAGSCIEIVNSIAHFVVRNCTLINSDYGNSNEYNAGIRLKNVTNAQIVGNNCSNNNGAGIALYNSDYCSVTGNTLTDNRVGISFRNTNGILLSSNKMINCGLFTDWNPGDSSSIDTTNEVNGKPLYYYVDEIGLGPSDFDNAGQVILINCEYCTVSGLSLSKASIGIIVVSGSHNTIFNNSVFENSYGVYFLSSDNNTIQENNVSSNRYGIYMRYSCNDNDISGNIISFNELYGIQLEYGPGENIISGNTINNNVDGIHLYSSYENIISGNKINNNGYGYGIYMWNSQRNIVSGNTVNNGSSGICSRDSDNNIISGNIVSFNERYGISICGSGVNTTVLGNFVSNNAIYGICISNTFDVFLSENDFLDDSLYIDGTLDMYRSLVIDTTNEVNGKPLYYYVDEVGLGPSDLDNAGQVILINCSYCTVSGLTISRADIGIYFYLSSFNTISDNIMNSNGRAIYLLKSNNNTISGNNLLLNEWGIYLQESNDTIISRNTANNNTESGIYLYRCNNNTISGNTASNNTKYGIYLYYYCDYNTVSENIAGNNIEYGIYLYYYCDYNTVSENIASNNIEYGIYLYYYCDYNTVSGNTAGNNIE